MKFFNVPVVVGGLPGRLQGDSPTSQYHFEKDILVLMPFEGREYTSYAVWETMYVRMGH